MKKNVFKISIAILILFGSCKSNDCFNRNEVFAKYNPSTKIYKNELAKQIRLLNPDQISYYLEGYKKTKDKEYINVNIQAEGLCATCSVLVKQWDNTVKNIQQTRAMGYYGAQLNNLQFDFIEDSTGVQLVYKSIESIKD